MITTFFSKPCQDHSGRAFALRIFTPNFFPINLFPTVKIVLRLVPALLVLLASVGSATAQATLDTTVNTPLPDSLRAKKLAQQGPPMQTVTTKPLPWQPNPKKSALYSAILPGSGQLYNRQYWKIPIIYAGVAASGYFFFDNRSQYRKYRKAYVSRLTDPNYQDEFTGLYSRDNLKTLQDAYKRYLDMTVLLTALGYTIQVLDAVTFAHLKNFDVSKDISFRFQPVADPTGVGVGLVMHF